MSYYSLQTLIRMGDGPIILSGSGLVNQNHLTRKSRPSNNLNNHECMICYTVPKKIIKMKMPHITDIHFVETAFLNG
jgi:hypothetical protein